MKLRQLRYFCAIAEEGQISRAAQRLHMAQPPLSFQLKLLEEELGVKLVDRNTRYLSLTQAGHLFYQRASQILDMLGNATSEIRDMSHGVYGVLSMGSPPAIGSLYMPDRIKRFHVQYPHIRFSWREGNTYRMLELLEAQVIEFGIVRLPIPEGEYDAIPLLTESWVAITDRKDKAYARKKRIRLNELAAVPLIMMHRQEGIRCHDMVLDEMRAMDITPTILCESDNISAILSLVARSVGVAILPASALAGQVAGKFRCMEIADCTLQSSSAIVWRRGKRLSVAAELFLETFPLSMQDEK
ncbi:MAG: LysR family transcriptional regulator [Burkholderiaceae bacterium]|jgi:DNA-binding transcriptional LysR family regulator|nr:LysR family transcriptional regulator [Burkholderiaceae bacterium]